MIKGTAVGCGSSLFSRASFELWYFHICRRQADYYQRRVNNKPAIHRAYQTTVGFYDEISCSVAVTPLKSLCDS